MTVAPSLVWALFTWVRPCETGLAPVKSIETVFASATLAKARIRPRESPDVKRVILGSRFHLVRRMLDIFNGVAIPSTVTYPHTGFLLGRRETDYSPPR